MTAKQSIAWLQAAWKDDKKRINLLLVSGLAGMLLLCMSEWLPAGQSTQNAAQSSQQSQTAAEYEQHLETRLAALIRAMDGAGETVVMVTLDCGEETTYAADTRTEKTSEDTRSSAASQRTHLLAGAQPVVQSVQAPQVRGVAVLCQGGVMPDPAPHHRTGQRPDRRGGQPYYRKQNAIIGRANDMEGRATKRYATLAALTLALGGAVFLNWSFAGRTPQAGTPEAVVQTSAEADEDTVQTAARQLETNAAVEPMTAQAVLDPLESEPQTAAQADAAEEMESGGQAGKNYGEAQLVSVSKDSGTEFFEQARLNRSKARDEALDAIKRH